MVEPKEKAWFIYYGIFGLTVSFTELNPTGKWKLVYNKYGDNTIFIQHKGLFFKKWISENDITFIPIYKKEIFDCKLS